MLVAKVEHYQTIIYETLKQYLHEHNADAAAQHWRRNYATGPVLALQRYVSDIYRDYDPKVDRGVIYRALVNELSGNNQRQKTPTKIISALNQHHQTKDYNEVFCAFVRSLLDAASLIFPQGGRLLAQKLSDELSSLSVAEDTKKCVQIWLLDVGAPLDVSLSINTMRHIVHSIYLLLCHGIGPVEADKLITKCITQIQNQYPKGLDPKEFL